MNRYKLVWVRVDSGGEGQVVFPQKGTLRIGRASTNDVSIPDDLMISRQHAVAEIQGDEFLIRYLEGAANGLSYAGKKYRQIRLVAGDSFQNGGTEFLCLDQDEGEDQSEAPRVRESAYSAEALQKSEFRNPIEQLEILANLPEQIASTRSDEEFAVKVAELLLQGIPQADAVAVVQFVESDLLWTSESLWQRFPSSWITCSIPLENASKFMPAATYGTVCLAICLTIDFGLTCQTSPLRKASSLRRSNSKVNRRSRLRD